MCQHRPCWGTPEELTKIVQAGFGPRLMKDWWNGDDKRDYTEILSPAIVGSEGGDAPAWPTGRCTFLTQENKCELHDLGLKPTEGATACCSQDSSRNVHFEMAKTWGTDEGRKAVQEWE